MKDSGDAAQSGKACVIASCWAVGPSNQCGDRCSLTASQDENHRANHIKGVHGYDESS